MHTDNLPVSPSPALAAPDETTQPARQPVTRRFRRRTDVVRLSPEQAQRQGRIAGVAWDKLGGRDAVVAFLNTQDDAIDGRPIDVAVASDAGFALVEQALVARAAAAPLQD